MVHCLLVHLYPRKTPSRDNHTEKAPGEPGTRRRQVASLAKLDLPSVVAFKVDSDLG